MHELTLVIGNRNYSSWSLRAWLYLRKSGLAFREVFIPLHGEQWSRELPRYTPAGRVPVLLDGELRLWDTVAIFAHLQERFPDAALGWPAEPRARALARSISAEMHSGFLGIREQLPQNLRARRSANVSPATRRQIERVCQIWTSCREVQRDAGPWLFGRFSLADVMYAPVALRFVTYGIAVEGGAAEFVEAVTRDPLVQQWVTAAEVEQETLPVVDELRPLAGEKLSLG